VGEKTGRVTMIGRGLRRRCPNCGTIAFSGWFRMHVTCPGCGIEFEREQGYWVGAVTINTVVTFVSFVGLFVILTVVTWPDVPWTGVMVATLGVNLIVPVIFYPVSKTLWSAIEISWHPLEPDELAAARRRTGTGDADGLGGPV
jgi:uncharacterized protein (DUF983 family)